MISNRGNVPGQVHNIDEVTGRQALQKDRIATVTRVGADGQGINRKVGRFDARRGLARNEDRHRTAVCSSEYPAPHVAMLGYGMLMLNVNV